MYAVLLTVEFVVCIAMIGVILLQRSEGGGLGLGSGGGMGGLMTGRGAANVLTRTTVVLATIFICTSIALTLVAKSTQRSNPLGDVLPTSAEPVGTLPDVTPSTPVPAEPSATPTPSDGSAGSPLAPAESAPALSLPTVPAPAAPAPDAAAPAAATPAPAPANPQPATSSPQPAPSGGSN